MTPEISSFFSINQGGYSLEKDIMKALNTKYSIDLNEKDIRYVIQEGHLRLNGVIQKESTTIIDGVIEQFNNKILQESKKYGYNLAVMDFVVVGGTSTIIEKSIRKFIPHATFVDNAEWSNADGWLIVGELKYGAK
jgi:hypothetical protein